MRNDLPTSVLLIATENDTGKASEWRHTAVVCAILAELLVEGSLEFAGKKLTATEKAPSDDAYRSTWETIRASSRPCKVDQWILQLGGTHSRPVTDALLDDLVREKVLSRRQGKFGRTDHPRKNPAPERRVREQLDRDAKQLPPNRRAVLLISILVETSNGQMLDPERSARRARRALVETWRKNPALDRQAAAFLAGVRDAVGHRDQLG